MPTKFMKLGFDERVLRRLANETENGAPVGYVLDVGLNYYRGTPISAVERLELTVDGGGSRRRVLTGSPRPPPARRLR